MTDNNINKPLLSKTFDNLIQNFNEYDIESEENKKFWSDNISENDIDNIDNKDIEKINRNYSKSLDYKNISKKKNKNRINIELLDVNKNENIEIKINKDFEIKQIGFPNIGNSCYMNSFLQILIHTPNFINELKRLKKINKIEDELINSLINIQKKPRDCLSKIKTIMSSEDKSYSDYCQNDSQKFGIELLNKVISVIKNEKDSTDSEGGDINESKIIPKDLKNLKRKKFKNYENEQIKNEISLENMFQLYESQIKIQNKTNEIKKIIFEPHLSININLTNNPNKRDDLISLLKDMYNEDINKIDMIEEIKEEIIIQDEVISNNSEKLDNKMIKKECFCKKIYNCILAFLCCLGCCCNNKKNEDNKINLDEENKNTTYFSIRKLLKLPKILIITINRAILEQPFNMNYLHFEKTLDIKQFLDKDILDISNLNTEYTLYAINKCKGNTKDSGHYISYINIQDNWYKFNDENVSQSNPKFDSKYVVGLFYIRKEEINKIFINS